VEDGIRLTNVKLVSLEDYDYNNYLNNISQLFQIALFFYFPNFHFQITKSSVFIKNSLPSTNSVLIHKNHFVLWP